MLGLAESPDLNGRPGESQCEFAPGSDIPEIQLTTLRRRGAMAKARATRNGKVQKWLRLQAAVSPSNNHPGDRKMILVTQRPSRRVQARIFLRLPRTTRSAVALRAHFRRVVRAPGLTHRRNRHALKSAVTRSERSTKAAVVPPDKGKHHESR